MYNVTDMETRRKHKHNNLIRNVESLVEVIALSLLYYFVWDLEYRQYGIQTFYGSGKYVLMLVYAILIVVIFWLCEGFKFGSLRFFDVVMSSWISLLIVNVISYLQICLMSNQMVSLIPVVLLTLGDFFITIVLCYIYTFIYYKINPPHDMLLISGGPKGLSIKKKIERRSDKYRIRETIKLDETLAYADITCVSADELTPIYEMMSGYESVILNDIPADTRNELLKYCYKNGIRTYVVPKISDIIMLGSDDITIFDTPIRFLEGMGLSGTQRFIKRIVDLVLGFIAMIIAMPIMLVTAIAIKIDDGGPVFFRQERVTIDGKLFSILKLRSMIVNANEVGKVEGTTKEDPRVTRVGRLIRRYRIDELPQIFNILKGEMSIVGPRPECREFYEKYSEEIPEFVFRSKVKAGLTGYAQVYGRYNTSAYDKLRLDLMYIEKYTLLLDIKIILMTLKVLLKKESTEGFDDDKESDTNTVK